jgi:hypothetical protein
MLEQMKNSGATGNEMSIAMMEMNKKMKVKGQSNVEDSVDALVKKLEGHGKKIKIIEEGEDEDESE